MRVRFMRLLVFFDLPVETAKQRKEYRCFRHFLIKDGYLMLQESVYSKMVMDDANANSVILRLKKNRPSCGLVQLLKVTEKQFAGMEDITGSRPEFKEMDTIERLVIL